MPVPVLILLMVGMLVFNFVLWKRRGAGGPEGAWRRHVEAFIGVLEPVVGEPVVEAIVLQPAGSVGRQARAEQMRGISVLSAGMGGELQQAAAEHRASERAEREELPPMTALAVCQSGRRVLVPVVLEAGVWRAGAGGIERSWSVGEARYETSGRTLTVQLTITLLDGSWEGRYEYARDPAKYADAVVADLTATG